MRAYAETTSCVHLHTFRRFSRQTQVGGQWQQRLNLRAQEKGRSVHFNSKLAWNDFPILKKRFANEASSCAAPFAERRLQRFTGSWSDLHSMQQKKSNMQMLNLKVWCMICPEIFHSALIYGSSSGDCELVQRTLDLVSETEVLNNSPRRNGFCVEVACYTWTWMLRRCDVAEKITW